MYTWHFQEVILGLKTCMPWHVNTVITIVSTSLSHKAMLEKSFNQIEFFFCNLFIFFCNKTIQYLGYITYSHLTYKKRYRTYNTLLTVTYLQYTLQYLQYITYNSLITVHVTKKLNTKQIVVN